MLMHSEHTSKKSAARALQGRHRKQISQRAQEVHHALSRYYAITYGPGDRTNNFLGKTLRPAGSTILSIVSYDYREVDGLAKRSMNLRGFRGSLQADGEMHYADPSFVFEATAVPRVNRRGGALNPERHAALIEMLHRMDRACERQSFNLGPMKSVPRFPRIFLGFASSNPPKFEDTQALRRLAARSAGIPLAELGRNGSVLLRRLLEDTWHSQFLAPDAHSNPTGLLLVDAEYCTQARRALRCFEDFSSLLGFPTWNPARAIDKHFEVANPAHEVLRDLRIDTTRNFSQPISQELIDEAVRRMRQAIDPVAGYFTLEELLDGLTSPDKPLTAWSLSLPRLRSPLAAYVNECVTDEDLLRAARNPKGPLWASGGCGIQVLRRRSLKPEVDFRLTPEVLGRRIIASLWRDSWSSQGQKEGTATMVADEMNFDAATGE